jgi:hypothetical protein
MVLWWAWSAFNAGSVQTIASGGLHVVAALAATNTALAAGAGGVTAIAMDAYFSRGRSFDVFRTLNGILGVSHFVWCERTPRVPRVSMAAVLSSCTPHLCQSCVPPDLRLSGPRGHNCWLRIHEPMGGCPVWHHLQSLYLCGRTASRSSAH